MDRRLAKHTNLALLVCLLVLCAVWLGPEGRSEKPQAVPRVSASPPLTKRATSDERYYSGNRFNGVVLEMQNGHYTERYQSCVDGSAKLISKGRWVKDKETLTLIDETSGIKRDFEYLQNELIRVNSRGDYLVYAKTGLDWEGLLLKEASPYSVNGIRLGYTLDEVEACWGALKPDPKRKNIFCPVGLNNQEVELDPYGRVESVSGTSLLRGNETLLTTNERFETALLFGTKREYKVVCNSGGPYPIRRAERILGDYDLEILGFNREVLKDNYPKEFKAMSDRGDDLGKISTITLSLGRLSSAELAELSSRL